jgi:tRNA(Ile)-lysidine synthase
LQARARTARWKALVDVARAHGGAIATAHHADDRAETLVMRLLRGAGLRGLAVLPARAAAPGAKDVTVLRPLLRTRRTDILAHLAHHDVPYASDPSNDDPRYLRTRVRQRLLPLLAELDPQIVSHLGALADELTAEPGGLAAGAGHAEGTPAWTSGLPRPTQTALAALARSRSPNARVWLPDGLVVSVGSGRAAGARANGTNGSKTRRRIDAEGVETAGKRARRLPEGKPNG